MGLYFRGCAIPMRSFGHAPVQAQFTELSLKSLVRDGLTLTFPLSIILVFYNNSLDLTLNPGLNNE
jgi:hypothetical protein